MRKLAAVILDMDGLMFDTGRLAYEAYLLSAKRYDYQMTPDVYYDLTGRTHPAILEKMKQLYGEDQPIEKWRKAMIEEKENLLQKQQRVYTKKGLLTLLDYAKTQDIKVIVASSNLNSQIERYLALENITTYIDDIVSGEEVTHGKPDPEIFLRALAKSGVSKEEAIVFEDSIVGITAANRAQLRSILIPDDLTDLPTYQGKVAVDTTKFEQKKAQPTFEFADLAQATAFMQQQFV